MSEAPRELIFETVDSQEQVTELLERLFDVAKPGAIFSEPVSAEGHTVITASEVVVAMGAGFASGGGSGSALPEDEDEAQEIEIEDEELSIGFGSGGGGGGGSTGRPVAAIIVSSEGVRVEPIVDATKLGLAFFTMLGSVFFMGSKMRRAAKGK